MALHIDNALVPSHVGPGYLLYIRSDLVGPIANDDWFLVEVSSPGGGNYFCAGDQIAAGLHSQRVVLGEAKKIGQGTLDQYIAPGATVSLLVYLIHANFANADTPITSLGWTWDPTGGLFRLAADALSGTGGNATLDGIYNAVTKQFQRPT